MRNPLVGSGVLVSGSAVRNGLASDRIWMACQKWNHGALFAFMLHVSRGQACPVVFGRCLGRGEAEAGMNRVEFDRDEAGDERLC